MQDTNYIKSKKGQQKGHTILSYYIGLIAFVYMLFLGSRYNGEDWGNFAYMQFAFGITGWAYIAITSGQGLFPKLDTFNQIEMNSVKEGLYIFAANVLLQYLLSTTLAISNTEQAFYAIFAAPCEENFFRGFLLPVSQKILGDIPAVILQALVFMSLHTTYAGTYMYLSVFIAGMLYGLHYLYRKDITAIMIAHLVVNSWTAISLLSYGVIQA